jgi:hypothetical protein
VQKLSKVGDYVNWLLNQQIVNYMNMLCIKIKTYLKERSVASLLTITNGFMKWNIT